LDILEGAIFVIHIRRRDVRGKPLRFLIYILMVVLNYHQITFLFKLTI